MFERNTKITKWQVLKGGASMPINNEEFKGGKLHRKVEEEIISFLNERKEGAFTSQEIMA